LFQPAGSRVESGWIIQKVRMGITNAYLAQLTTPLDMQSCVEERIDLEWTFYEAFWHAPDVVAIDTNRIPGLATADSDIEVETEARLLSVDDYMRLAGTFQAVVDEVRGSSYLRDARDERSRVYGRVAATDVLRWDGFCTKDPDGSGSFVSLCWEPDGPSLEMSGAPTVRESIILGISGSLPATLSEPRVWARADDANLGVLRRRWSGTVFECCDLVAVQNGDVPTFAWSVTPRIWTE
jgi:hypothetical protein